MAKIIQFEPDVFVGHQLVEADFAELAARGFRSVVNNRPTVKCLANCPIGRRMRRHSATA
jgi:protein tyrosine phosphatase (PTP) superfamily phosphohydrolase (DUF442 family)